jgi:hypothetical protein
MGGDLKTVERIHPLASSSAFVTDLVPVPQDL